MANYYYYIDTEAAVKDTNKYATKHEAYLAAKELAAITCCACDVILVDEENLFPEHHRTWHDNQTKRTHKQNYFQVACAIPPSTPDGIHVYSTMVIESIQNEKMR